MHGAHRTAPALTALMAPVAVRKRFTSCAESTDRPLLMDDDTDVTPSPLELGSTSESGLTHTLDFSDSSLGNG